MMIREVTHFASATANRRRQENREGHGINYFRMVRGRGEIPTNDISRLDNW